MINISGYGLSANLIASNTFPNGINISAFADDADATDFPDLQVGDTGFGLNGDMATWSKATGPEVGMNIIATSDDDINMEALLEANRVGKGKRGARDIITLTLNYPNGSIVTLSKGIIIVGSIIPGVQQSGRMKTRQYRFRFERVNKTMISNETI